MIAHTTGWDTGASQAAVCGSDAPVSINIATNGNYFVWILGPSLWDFHILLFIFCRRCPSRVETASTLRYYYEVANFKIDHFYQPLMGSAEATLPLATTSLKQLDLYFSVTPSAHNLPSSFKNMLLCACRLFCSACGRRDRPSNTGTVDRK
jgi:hypothetical protein